MTYQCIPLSADEYKQTLQRVLRHPVKSKKYAAFKSKYDFTLQAAKKLQSLAPNEHLQPLLDDLQKTQKACHEGMARLLDSEFRAQQKEQRKTRS